METRVLKPTFSNLQFCSELLKKGNVVAVPTETVYGLAANAFDDKAVLKIFKVKGRPADNPLICHVSSFEMFNSLTHDLSKDVFNLIENFWPGPLTVIVKRSARFSKFAVAGLPTVGIRFSSNNILNRLIDLCGFPLAAPSANLSKKPSSTSVEHILSDFNGKIGVVLDGGQCEIGVESTVVKVEEGKCVVLRPGFITLEMLQRVVKHVELSDGVIKRIDCGSVIESPGLKHKHYSPKAEVVVVKGSLSSFVSFVSGRLNEKVWCVVFDGEQVYFKNFFLIWGETLSQQAKELFSVLRKVDELKIEKVFFRCPSEKKLGLAIYNRLIRAANFNVVEL